MKLFSFTPLLAALFVAGVTSGAALETCNGKDNLFKLDSARLESDTYAKTSEICIVVKGEFKQGFTLSDTSAEYSTSTSGFTSTWSVKLTSSLKNSQQPTVGSDQELRACFFLPPKLANGEVKVKDNEISIRVKLTTPNVKNGDPVRVACLMGKVRVSSP